MKIQTIFDYSITSNKKPFRIFMKNQKPKKSQRDPSAKKNISTTKMLKVSQKGTIPPSSEHNISKAIFWDTQKWTQLVGELSPYEVLFCKTCLSIKQNSS